MTTNLMNNCSIASSGNVITARARMSYPSLYKKSLPAGETDPEKARYKLSLVFPKEADLRVLAEAVEKCAVDRWGADYKTKYAKVKKPFLFVRDHPNMGFDPDEYEMFIRTASDDRPNVIRADRTNVDEDKAEEAYAGRWARATIRPFAYDHKTGGKGISLGLQNVQLLDHADPVGRVRAAAEDEFESVGGEAGKPASIDDLYT